MTGENFWVVNTKQNRKANVDIPPVTRHAAAIAKFFFSIFILFIHPT
jgi:hypothetical protein